MKFVHTADIHMGMHFSKSSFGRLAKTRREEIKETFFRLIDYVRKENIELLIIAGDLFEETSIEIDDLKEVDYKFKQIPDTTVLIVAGNHDPLTKHSVYNMIEWSKNVIIFGTEISFVEIERLNVRIYGLSWDRKLIDKPLLDEIRISDKNYINILIAHGDTYQTSNYLPINKNVLKESDFHYVALGHIHKPTFISENIAYSGSLEPLDFSETGKHGFIIGDIDTNYREINFVPFSKRQFYVKDLEIDQYANNEVVKDLIMEQIVKNSKDDFYRFKLKGYHDPEIHFKCNKLMEFFYNQDLYIEIIDETVPNYDLDIIQKENEDNIIGMYVKELLENSIEDEIAHKALYVGLELLLNEKVK